MSDFSGCVSDLIKGGFAYIVTGLQVKPNEVGFLKT